MEEIEKYDFGLRLKRLRERKGYSQVDLAKKIGVSKSSISNYEANIQAPTLEHAKHLAQILDTTLDFLAGVESVPMIKVYNCSEKQIAWLKYTIQEILEQSETN